MEKFNNHLASVSKWWEDDNQIFIVKQLTGMRDSAFERIKVFTHVLQEIYPDSWEMQIHASSITQYDLYLLIYFPEITITNTVKEKHTIYDMFVRFSLLDFDDGTFEIDSMQGVRTKVSYGEMASKYSHSHLPSNSHKTLIFSSFCLGSSEIRQLMILVNQSEDSDINLIRYFLQDIKSYLSWESLEGGPHIKMKNVVLRGTMNDLPIVESMMLRDIRSRLKDNSLYEYLSIDIDSNGRAFIIDDLDYECTLRMFYQKHFSYNSDRYLCYKDEGGNYYGTKSEIRNFKFTKDSLVFHGKKIFFTLDKELPDTQGELYVHPTIKQYITQILEYDINKYQLKHSAFTSTNR